MSVKRNFDVSVKYYKSQEEVISVVQSEPLEINEGVMLWRFDSYEKAIALQSTLGKNLISSQCDYYEIEESTPLKKRKSKS